MLAAHAETILLHALPLNDGPHHPLFPRVRDSARVWAFVGQTGGSSCEAAASVPVLRINHLLLFMCTARQKKHHGDPIVTC